ncbi:RNA polymerase sigma factor [Pirellulaceae bacterium SH449]
MFIASETLVAAQGGDVTAINCLMGHATRLAWAIGHKELRNWDDAEELGQDVAFKVYRHLAKCKAETGGEFVRWVTRVALRTCLDRNRQAASRPTMQDQIPEIEVDYRTSEALEAAEILLGVADRVGTVEEVRLAIDGCSQAEIAKRLGIGKRQVQTAIERHREAVHFAVKEEAVRRFSA